MKKIVLLLGVCLSGIMLKAQTLNSYYVDLGCNDVTNGNTTVSPNSGVYWNNLTDPSTLAPAVWLVDYNNMSSGISVSVSQTFSKNGILNGGLLSPSSTSLGNMAVATATQDYFYTTLSGELTIQGLNPALGYRFSTFGSRNYSTDRKTEYTFTGATVVKDTLQTSGTSIGGGNSTTIAVSGIVRPDATGKIKLLVSVNSGGFAYLNMMKIEAVSMSVDVDYFVDFGPNDITNGDATVSPDSKGKYWNNITSPAVTTTPISIVNRANANTGMALSILSAFSTNGKLHGGLLTPDSTKLNDLAIATATEDYFFSTATKEMEFTGLKANSVYRFTIFGTRDYTGTRISQYTLSGKTIQNGFLQTSGTNLGGTGINANNSSVYLSDTMRADVNGKIKLGLTPSSGGFAYIGCIKIKETTNVGTAGTTTPTAIVKCAQLDANKISFMGSSVEWGLFAGNSFVCDPKTDATISKQYNYSQGYQAMYSQYLKNTNTLWHEVNISEPGNNTSNLLSRYSDVTKQCSKYVVYGLSLGNEGLAPGSYSGPYNSFKTNLKILVDSARLYGMEPIIMNCYPRGNYDLGCYDIVQQMDSVINTWNVASVNLLGAIDNGVGKWATGYQHLNADGTLEAAHPNDAGYTEFFYAIVPSMMEALNAGKVQPAKLNNTFLTFNKQASNYQLEIVPENIAHPFTYSFDVRTTATGLLSSFNAQAGSNSLVVAANGVLNYTASQSAGINGVTVINDGNWHKITLSHYYARGISFLFVDGVLQGSVNEKVVPTKFILSGENAVNADYRELYFFRSAMSAREIKSMINGNFIKSSLEIYAPLDGQAVGTQGELYNRAQSLNTVQKVVFAALPASSEVATLSANEAILSNANIYTFPNPANDCLNLNGVSETSLLEVYGLSGQLLISTIGKKVDISALSQGFYTIKVSDAAQRAIVKFIKE